MPRALVLGSLLALLGLVVLSAPYLGSRETQRPAPAALPPSASSPPPAPRAPVSAPEPKVGSRARPQPPPGPAPPPAPWSDADGGPTPEFVQELLDDTIRAQLPSHKLSSEELARLTEAVVTLRRTREELRALPFEPATAERRRALNERVARAVGTFEEILDMGTAEFTARVQPGVGIDTGMPDPDAPLPEPEFLPPREAGEPR